MEKMVSVLNFFAFLLLFLLKVALLKKVLEAKCWLSRKKCVPLQAKIINKLTK